jgi:hypothetical protein
MDHKARTLTVWMLQALAVSDHHMGRAVMQVVRKPTHHVPTLHVRTTSQVGEPGSKGSAVQPWSPAQFLQLRLLGRLQMSLALGGFFFQNLL